MKKHLLVSFLVFIFCALLPAEEIEIPFNGGVSYIPQVDGQDDLDNIRIVYDNGYVFYGKGTEEGYPIEGDLENEAKGVFYSGKFDENEKYTGDGILETNNEYYEGSFLNGKRNGYGRLEYKNKNEIYEGDFLNGEREGKGVLYNTDGVEIYSGEWHSDLPNGLGVMTDSDGNKFDGEFENGKIREIGIKTNASGAITKGYWQTADFPEGENCLYIGTDGRKYSGDIACGKFDGYGSYTDEEGTVYDGSFSENQRTGVGQQLYEDGSSYTGQFFANQRNGIGSFEFSNGYKYEGGFLNGSFYGTGYLSAEENEEITIIASDEWDGVEIPENSESQSTSDGENLSASIKLPKNGKILFSNGDMWEGAMDNGMPVAGLGIWTTQEERIARMSKPDCAAVLCSYQLNDTIYDLSSVYTAAEVFQIVNSTEYLVGFRSFYENHSKTINKIVGGLQGVAALLMLVPNPLQPIAAAVDIGLSAVQISLKTTMTALDIRDACVAGNMNLIPGILGNYGKETAWDALNVLMATPGAGKIVGKIGSHVVEGMGHAGQRIAHVAGRAIQKNKVVANAFSRLEKLGKVGGNGGKAIAKVATESRFFQWVARNGGKVTHGLKNGWTSVFYNKLFKQYGDDATKFIFKYGNDIAEQLGKNGDLIIAASKKYGDDIARAFIKNGDKISSVARQSKYPSEVIRYLNKCSNLDDGLKLVAKSSRLGEFVGKYGDDAISCIERYGDNALSIFEKNGDVFAKGLKNLPVEKHKTLVSFFASHPESASALYGKYGNELVDLYGKVGGKNQSVLLDILKRDGDDALKYLKNLPDSELSKAIKTLDTIPLHSPAHKIINYSNDYISKLSALDRDVVGKYATPAYKTINRSLRQGIPNEDALRLHNVVGNSKIPENVTGFRAENGFIGDRAIYMRNGKYNLPKQGEVVTNRAFTSTSLSPKYANSYLKKDIPVLQEIQVPKGSKGLYISDYAQGLYGPHQQEVLLDAGSKFKVLESKILPAGTEINGIILEKATAYVKMALL